MDPQRRPEHDDPDEPRTAGEVARLGPVQIALGLLLLFLGLLALWAIWPLING